MTAGFCSPARFEKQAPKPSIERTSSDTRHRIASGRALTAPVRGHPIGLISISDGTGIGFGQRLTHATAASLIAAKRASRSGLDLTKIMNFMFGSGVDVASVCPVVN
jgi:hypothetical protein